MADAKPAAAPRARPDWAMIGGFVGIAALMVALIVPLDNRITRIESRIDGLEARNDRHFTELHTRITGLDTRITDLHTRIDTRITGLETRINNRISDLDNRITAFETRIDNRLATIEERLRENGGHIRDLDQRVTDQQRIISGIVSLAERAPRADEPPAGGGPRQ